MRLTLPSGGWAELRDPNTLSRRDRKEFLRLAEATSEGLSPMEAGLAVIDGMLSQFVTAWSFDAPLPATTESLDSLSIDDGNALEAAAVELRDKLFPDFSPKLSTNGQLMPGTPTLPSKV